MDKVVVRQDRDFRAEITAQGEEDDALHPVTHVHELSPYTMMLTSLGLCTTIVLHTYAQHHDVALELAEITVTYHREEHRDLDADRPYEEWIEERLSLEGDLTDAERERLAHVGHACSIRKMLESGIEVRTENG
ncbi:MAG: OsmC family protein, partial [Anaerolineae bacterium]